jgi:hypothetical protein
MSDQPRDWDKELADIDKAIARLPSQAAPPSAAGGGAAAPSKGGRQTGVAPGGKLGILTTWLRVGLGMALAIAITQWPYPSACGFNLVMYLGAIGVVAIAGLWSAVSSWRRRLGLGHILSLLVLLWGLVLSAREVLPRTGYARHVRTWTCATTGVEAR